MPALIYLGMITIKINTDYLIQIHKTQVSQPLTGQETLVFTESLNEQVTTYTDYFFQELKNCYLFTINTNKLAQSDIDSQLEVMLNNSVLYRSKVKCLTAENE